MEPEQSSPVTVSSARNLALTYAADEEELVTPGAAEAILQSIRMRF